MASKRPTRMDVAERAGVAPSTVSLVLNDRAEQVGIALSTCKRVIEAARVLGYYPNRQIRAVRSGRTGTLGVYLRHDQWGCASGYWAAMRSHLEHAVAEFDLQLLVHCAREDCPTEEAFARQAGGAVDGLIILHSGNDPIAQRLMETGMQAVEVGDSFSPLPFVGVDGESGIAQVLGYLKEKGYRRPAFVNFPSQYQDNSRQRREAFRTYGPELFETDLPCIDSTWGGEALDEILRLDARPDCAVCTSDELAFGMFRRCKELGIPVPEFGITGFDCIEDLCGTVFLTSVETPLREIARQGVQKLLRMIEGLPVERATVLPAKLRPGDTA